MRRLILAAFIVLAVVPAVADAYTGTVSVWRTGGGRFVAANDPGTFAGVQACMDSLNATGGGTIRIGGAGRVLLTETLRWRGSGITLEAVSDSVVFVNAGAIGDTMIAITGSNNTIRGIRFEGYAGTKTEGYGIVVNGPRNRIENSRFLGMPKTAIRTTAAADSTKIIGCTISGVGTANDQDAHGIGVQGSDGVWIHDNTISATWGDGIFFEQGATNGSVKENRILSTISTNATSEGVFADSTCKKIEVTSNRISFVRGSGVQMEADSSLVQGNLITSCTYGFHIAHGGRVITFKKNLVANSQNQNVYIELWVGSWQLHVEGNFLINPGAYNLHLESNTAVSGDILIQGNYLYGGNNATLSALRVLSIFGGQLHRVKILGNTIHGARKHGIEFLYGSGTGFWSKCVVKGNIIDSPAQYGVATVAAATASSVYISDNTVIDAGSGELSLSPTNWTYEGMADATLRATTVVAEDSLRVGTPTTASPATITGEITAWRDLHLKNTKGLWWTSAAGADLPVFRVDSLNTVRLQPITGSNFDVYKTDGTLGTRFYGTGGVSITGGGNLQISGVAALSSSGNDNRVHSRDAAGGLASRNAANSSNLTYLDDDGDLWVANAVTAKDSVVAEGVLHGKTKAVVIDSLRVNGPIETAGSVTIGNDDSYRIRNASGSVIGAIFPEGTDDVRIRALGGAGVIRFRNFGNTTDYLTIGSSGQTSTLDLSATGAISATGSITAGAKVDATDSLNLTGILRVGSKSGIPNRHLIGSGGTTQADSLTLVLNGQGGVNTQYSPKLELQRNGSVMATISHNGTNFAQRISPDGSQFFRWGTLNSETAAYLMTLSNSGQLEIGTGVPDKALEVNGAGSFTDSLRVNRVFMQAFRTLADNTTPSVADGNLFVCAPAGSTTITDFTNGTDGQEIRIIFSNANATLSDSGNLKLNGGFTSTADDSIVLLRLGGVWYELSRSPN